MKPKVAPSNINMAAEVGKRMFSFDFALALKPIIDYSRQRTVKTINKMSIG